jgi:hypothetical protein
MDIWVLIIFNRNLHSEFYSSKEVQLKWYNNKKSVELEDYSPSGIWDLVSICWFAFKTLFINCYLHVFQIRVPGTLTADKSKMMFEIVIRRFVCFYTLLMSVSLGKRSSTPSF